MDSRVVIHLGWACAFAFVGLCAAVAYYNTHAPVPPAPAKTAQIACIEGSFVNLKPDPRKADLELQLAILKRVIEVKLADRAAAEKAAVDAERKRVLLAALANKTAEELAGLSKEQLEAEIAALSA